MDPEKAQMETAMLNGGDAYGDSAPAPSGGGGGGGGDRSGRDVRCVEISNCQLVSASLCHDPQHRRLAISSIICGLSCIGVMSLIYSVQAREATNPVRSRMLSRKAKRWGIISIAVWVAILVISPALLVLVSYLVTFIN